jgi:hypothetical protein
MVKSIVNLQMWNELYDQLDENLHRDFHSATSITSHNYLAGQLKYHLEFRLQNMFNDPVVRQLRDNYITGRHT